MKKLDGSFKHKHGAYTVVSRADTVEHETDPVKLGRPVAEEIAAAIERGIANNPARTRDGKRRLFVRTGNLSRSITIEQRGRGFEVLAPDGYLQDDAMIDRLLEVVPVIEDPFLDPQVDKAIEETGQPVVKRRRR